jgi:hemerythrin
MNLIAPELLIWSESMSLGHPRIDDEHQHLVALIAQLQAASDDDLRASLKAVLDDATTHFSAENDLMTATGFPPRDCHIKEHEAVLTTLHGVTKRLAQGDHYVVRRLSAELAAWFPAHVQHLDSALSHWLCKLEHGGKPVVLRIGSGKARKSPGRRDVAPASV